MRAATEEMSRATHAGAVTTRRVSIDWLRKPPLTRRFKARQTGNRWGRPRESKNCKAIVREIANEMLAVTEDGRLRRRSILEFMLLALRNLAAEGNVRAFREYKKWGCPR